MCIYIYTQITIYIYIHIFRQRAHDSISCLKISDHGASDDFDFAFTVCLLTHRFKIHFEIPGKTWQNEIPCVMFAKMYLCAKRQVMFISHRSVEHSGHPSSACCMGGRPKYLGRAVPVQVNSVDTCVTNCHQSYRGPLPQKLGFNSHSYTQNQKPNPNCQVVVLLRLC